MKAKYIRMRTGCEHSYSTKEISEIYIDGIGMSGFQKKADIYDYLKKYPNSIQVDRYPFPNLRPALSVNGEKYVRSEPNDTTSDNLLKLPRF